MSLNRCEQRLFDYVERHPEERHYWTAKVQSVYRRTGDAMAASVELEPLLWSYYEERSAVAAPFKEAVRTEGLRRTSMKNLAEFLLRLWTEPKPKKPASTPRLEASK
jgi:hypothetical protein